MVAERPRWLPAQATRNEVGLDPRAVRRCCGLPNAERCLHSHCVGIGMLYFCSSRRHTIPRPLPKPTRSLPEPTRPKNFDHPPLLAAGVAVNQYSAIFALVDREAWLAIIVRRTARYPAATDASCSERVCKRISA